MSTCVSVNGQWSNWETEACPVTCGNGQQLKTRKCNNPTPQFGGLDCTGLSTDYQACNNQPCPSNIFIPFYGIKTVKNLYIGSDISIKSLKRKT